MRKILKDGISVTDKRPVKKFKCIRGCACVWKSNEYQVHISFGKKHRLDKCPQCGMIGANLKSHV